MLQPRCSLTYCNTHYIIIMFNSFEIKTFKNNGLLWAQDPPSKLNQILFKKTYLKLHFY